MRARTTQREREADLGTFVHPHAANSSSYSLVNYVFIDDSEDATLEANVVESGREGERERESCTSSCYWLLSFSLAKEVT